MAGKRLFLILTLVSAINFLDAPPAQAGVLIRSSKVTAKVQSRPPRARLGRTAKSTAVAARMNPLGRSKDIGGVPSELAQIEVQQKYQKKLYRYNQKKARAEAKLQRKKERQRKLEERRRLKQRESARKKQQRAAEKASRQAEEQKQLEQEQSGEEGALVSQSDSGRERGAKVEPPSGKKKISFWSRFWQAMVGRKK